MEEEIFGPVLTVYVYDDNKFEETIELVKNTSGKLYPNSYSPNIQPNIQFMP